MLLMLKFLEQDDFKNLVLDLKVYVSKVITKIRAWKANQVFSKLRLVSVFQKHGCARRYYTLDMMTRVHTLHGI